MVKNIGNAQHRSSVVRVMEDFKFKSGLLVGSRNVYVHQVLVSMNPAYIPPIAEDLYNRLIKFIPFALIDDRSQSESNFNAKERKAIEEEKTIDCLLRIQSHW